MFQQVSLDTFWLHVRLGVSRICMLLKKIAGFIVNCLIIPMMYGGYFFVIYFSRLGRINESSLPAVDFDNLQVLNDGNPSLLEIHVN